MREFFRGWKRRLGVVALVMACIFAAGWVRSQYVFDDVYVTTTKINFDFQSMKSLIGCNFHVYRGRDPSANWLDVNYHAYDLRINTFSNSYQLKFHFDWAGFQYGTIVGTIHPDTQLTYDTTVLKIPYWSIVIPLAFLAAWSLLSKSRPAKTQPETKERKWDDHLQ